MDMKILRIVYPFPNFFLLWCFKIFPMWEYRWENGQTVLCSLIFKILMKTKLCLFKLKHSLLLYKFAVKHSWKSYIIYEHWIYTASSNKKQMKKDISERVHNELLFILNSGIRFGAVVKWSYVWIVFLNIYIWISGNGNPCLSHLEKMHGKQQSSSVFPLYRNIESEITPVKFLLLKEC